MRYLLSNGLRVYTFDGVFFGFIILLVDMLVSNGLERAFDFG